MKTILYTSVMMMAVLTLLTGVLYPLLMTAAAQLLSSDKANGSIVHANGAAAGSLLIAQKFTGDKYFQPRPSAVGFNPLPSGGTNYAPTNLALDTLEQARRDSFIVDNRLAPGTNVPVEMLAASGSGLDPHISPEAALLQVGRVARARNVDSSVLARLVHDHVEGRQWGLFGEPRVNVLQMNLALDGMHP